MSGATTQTTEDQLLQALIASNTWLNLLVEKLDLDPKETSYNFSAVSETTGQSRPVGKATLEERLAENQKLIEKLSGTPGL